MPCYPFYLYHMMGFMISSSIFSINNTIMVWMFMEMMSMTFIALLITTNNKESGSMYFFISFLSSSMIFLSIILSTPSNEFSMLMLLGLLLKLGLYPFAKWVMMLGKTLSYWNMFFFMTFMKMIPLHMMYLTLNLDMLIITIIIINIIIPSILALTFSLFKMIFMCSSIYQSAIMTLIMYLNHDLFMFYISLYFFLNLIIIYLMKKLNNYYYGNMIPYKKSYKFMLFISIMMYTYFPPMASFMLKWTTLEIMADINLKFFNIMILILMVTSVIMMWNYMMFIHENLYEQDSLLKFSDEKIFSSWLFFTFFTIFIMGAFSYCIYDL